MKFQIKQSYFSKIKLGAGHIQSGYIVSQESQSSNASSCSVLETDEDGMSSMNEKDE